MKGPTPRQYTFGEFRPTVDIAEGGACYRVTAELPGVRAEDLAIDFSGNTLIISGEKKPHPHEPDAVYHRERAWGTFQRTLTFAEQVDENGIDALFVDGELRVRLPKTGSGKTKVVRIPVRGA
jgi:HSP20 family protein